MLPRLCSGENYVIRKAVQAQTDYFLKKELWRGVAENLMEWVIVAKRARDDAMNTNDSPERSNQHQGPSGGRQLSPAPPEEEKARGDRYLV